MTGAPLSSVERRNARSIRNSSALPAFLTTFFPSSTCVKFARVRSGVPSLP